jgi:hypothetical protein
MVETAARVSITRLWHESARSQSARSRGEALDVTIQGKSSPPATGCPPPSEVATPPVRAWRVSDAVSMTACRDAGLAHGRPGRLPCEGASGRRHGQQEEQQSRRPIRCRSRVSCRMPSWGHPATLATAALLGRARSRRSSEGLYATSRHLRALRRVAMSIAFDVQGAQFGPHRRP